MKKFLSILLASAMCLGIVGCGSNDAAKTDNAQTETAFKTSQEGKLIWGTNAAFEPYESMEGDKVVGIDADIADAIAAKLGLEAQVENMDFDAIIPSVTAGKADIGLAGMTVNEERLNNVNFSEPYVEAGQAIIVKAGSEIKSAADLKDKVIGVQRGTTGDAYVSDEANGVGAASVERYSNGPDAAQSLLADKIDAVVIDNEPAKKIVENADDLVKLEENLTSEQYAIAVAKDNPELLDAVNAALKEMQESGELQAILDKYLNN